MPLKTTNIPLEKIDEIFNSAKKIFFIGISGVSMLSLAKYSYLVGKEIYGYDKKRGKNGERAERFAKVKYYSTPDSVCGMDLVIYSSAIDESNFEYQNAKKLKIPTLGRANFLEYISKRYKNQIAVSGTHGKSTTTSLITKALEFAGFSPTALCGAIMKDYQSELLWGTGDVMVYEACEYMDSFLAFKPSVGVILNVDYDHPDYFKSQAMLEESFSTFIKSSERVVLFIDDEGAKNAAIKSGKSVITVSMRDRDSDYFIKEEENGFSLFKKEKLLLSVLGKSYFTHMIIDMGVSAACAIEMGADPRAVSEALKEALGVSGRLEFIKKTDTGASIFDDYAHHPTEIEASLSSLKKRFKRVLCIFQPHTFSRTHFLFDKFTSALSLADELYILPTFSAREENVFSLSEEKLAKDSGGEFITTKDEIYERIKKSSADCIVFMGAGDVSELKN